ncbi:MAG TPA: ParB/RepB/Spo0J family partition protein [Syntrophorhabdaceae bacterium]|nr:ParB/RepB/Spo0J family partition protein [Syntrophorhabdaceae bacterium]HRR71786.1 ParB/RepB/Spo0J family partition protein [Syntrophorhabdaceae bacterium]
MNKKDPLGKGLSAILKDMEDKGDIRLIPVDQIITNPRQPRFDIKQETLENLAVSIREKGLLQPIVVRKKDRFYEIIAGERRYRAAVMAGLREIQASVKDYSDSEALEVALIENLQREDLNPIEVATVYDRFIKEFGYTQQQLADKIGIDRSTVANFIRILALPDWIKQLISEGRLTQGHARSLLSLKNEKEQKRFVDRILHEGISVRELEKEVRKRKEDSFSMFSAAEDILRAALGTKVNITYKKNKGKIIIEFYSREDVERILEILSR